MLYTRRLCYIISITCNLPVYIHSMCAGSTHGEGKEELLHNGFPPLWGHRQDAVHLMCSFSDLLCVVFPVNSTHSSYFLENPPLFSDRQCKLCTGSWEGNHIFFMIMCMLLLYLSCPLTRRLLSFTLVFNSPLHVLVSAYFCQLHVSFFVFLCLPVHAGLSPPPPPPPPCDSCGRCSGVQLHPPRMPKEQAAPQARRGQHHAS